VAQTDDSGNFSGYGVPSPGSFVPPVPGAISVRPVTRSQRGVFQPKIVTDGTMWYDKGKVAHFLATGEPTIFKKP
jgi:hypothetical protein